MAVVGGKPKIVRKARELGLSVTYVQHPREYERAHWPYVDQALLVDYTEIDRFLPLVRSLHEAFPFQHVVSLTEPGLLPAARVDDLLGLGGNPVSTVAMLLDKARMRRHLDRCGISPVAARVGETEADLLAFLRDHGAPAIVKPIDASGSVGILLVRDAGEVASTLADWRRLGLGRFLVEEYLDGPEVSVETLSYDGRHVVVGVTDKLCGPRFVEVGHSTPSRLPSHVRDQVGELVTTFLDVVGLRHGPAHTEVKVTRRGPVIIESHNRVGGDRINEMTEIAYGVDMDRHALGSRLGAIEPLDRSPRPRAGAAVRFLTPPPGRVLDVRVAEAVAADPALVDLVITVAPGDEIRPVACSEDRVGHVLARGETAAEAAASCEHLIGMIDVVVDGPA